MNFSPLQQIDAVIPDWLIAAAAIVATVVAVFALFLRLRTIVLRVAGSGNGLLRSIVNRTSALPRFAMCLLAVAFMTPCFLSMRPYSPT